MASKRKASDKEESTGKKTKKKKPLSREGYTEEVKTQARANAPKIRYMCFAHCSSTTEENFLGLVTSYGFRQLAVTSALHKHCENAKEEAKGKLADRIKEIYVSAAGAARIGWSDSDAPDKKFDHIRAMIKNGSIDVRTMAWDFWEQKFVNYKPQGECTTQVRVLVPRDSPAPAAPAAPLRAPALPAPAPAPRLAIMPPVPAPAPAPPPVPKVKIEVLTEPRVKLEPIVKREPGTEMKARLPMASGF